MIMVLMVLVVMITIVLVIGYVSNRDGGEEPKLYYNKESEKNGLIVERLKREPRFRPAFWCKNGHCQTLATSMLRNKLPHLQLRREYLETNDGGCVALDWSIESEENWWKSQKSDVEKVVLIILHGVFGGSGESYVRQLLHKATKLGWLVVIVNFRGAGTSLLRTPKAYCAGATEDVRMVFKHIAIKFPYASLYSIGYSMGANVLVKCLGEEGKETVLKGAVSISNPLDLLISANALKESWIGRGYSKAIVRSAHQYTRRHSSIFNCNENSTPEIAGLMNDALKTESLWEFDERATRVMWGFNSVEEYYSRSSSNQFISRVKIPLLFINALDDPLVPETCIPYDQFKSSEHCILATTKRGGHVAFLEDTLPWSIHSSWADSFALSFLTNLSSSPSSS